MPIVAMQDMLQHAHDNGYAVAAFEIHSLDVLEGVLDAAESCHSPLILAMSEDQLHSGAIELLMPSVESAAQRTTVPVAIQFHDGASTESAIHAINFGCNAVMIDAQQKVFDENIAAIRKVADMAHACGVPVECGLTGQVDSPEIKAFLEQTRVDYLAMSIGAGYRRRKNDSKPVYSNLPEINASIGIPIVMHGGAALSAYQCDYFIANGIAKINFGNALYDAVNSQIRGNAEDSAGDYSRLMRGVKEIVSAEVKDCLQLCKSLHRAGELLACCAPWTPVEHLIIYNVTGIGEQEVAAMTTEGRRTLSTIPGVREVVTVHAIKGDADYRYGWLIRFCHPAVINSYRVHPVHVDFADRLFRPVAGDRISIDYQWDVQQSSSVKGPASTITVSPIV